MNKEIKEYINDEVENFRRAYQEDMANDGIYTEEIFGMWKDYEVE